MGSRIGALKAAARKRGISLDEYVGRTRAGSRCCTACRQWKGASDFPADRSRETGLATTCRACRYTRTTNGPGKADREFMAGFGQTWCRECGAWVLDGRMGLCREHRNADRRNRYATDPQFRYRMRQHAHRRRNIDAVPPEGEAFLLQLFEGGCGYCGEPATTWDHVTPVSRRGRTTPGNIVPACLSCNSSKRDRDVFEWMESRGITPSDLLLDRLAFANSSLYG